jgi:FkbH-like protein
LFETASFSTEDSTRTKKYQQEARRNELKGSFASLDDYLATLEMVGEWETFDSFNVPRIAQLTQRSNQFNLRTIRYTETDITDIIKSEERFGFSLKLRDKFGNYGLINLIILDKISSERLFINTWIMSCRVLKRGVENLVLNDIVKFAKKNGYGSVIGEFIPTAKNGIVADLYSLLGFKHLPNGQFELSVKEYSLKKSFINNMATFDNKVV